MYLYLLNYIDVLYARHEKDGEETLNLKNDLLWFYFIVIFKKNKSLAALKWPTIMHILRVWAFCAKEMRSLTLPLPPIFSAEERLSCHFRLLLQLTETSGAEP